MRIILKNSILLVLFFMLSRLHAADVAAVKSLPSLAEQASKRDVPILLMVSQEYCSFCKTLKEEILIPMEISGDYTDRVVVAEMLLDAHDPITNWQGESQATSEIAAHYKVWVTPTLLFLDSEGKQLHKPMVGVNTVEMYGYYLDEALAKALKVLRSK